MNENKDLLCPTPDTKCDSTSTYIFNHPVFTLNEGLELVDYDYIIQQINKPNKKVDELRSEFQLNGKSELYIKEKKQLSTFLPSAKHCTGRGEKDVLELNGYIYFDLDFYIKKENNINESIAYADQAKSILSSDPFIYLLWKSISNSGLGFIVRFDGLAFENYLNTWYCVESYIKEKYGYSVDESTKNINRLNFISSDKLHLNGDAEKMHAAKLGWVSNLSINGKSPDRDRHATPEFQLVNLAMELKKTSERFYQSKLITTNSGHPIKVTDDFKYCPENHILNKFVQESIIEKHQHKLENNTMAYLPDGYYAVGLNLFNKMKKFDKGMRGKTLMAIMSNYIILNPRQSDNQYYSFLFAVNQTYCKEPLPPKELAYILNTLLKKKAELQPKLTVRKIIYTKNMKQKIEPDECMISLINVCLGKARKFKRNQCLELAINKLIEEREVITRTKLMELCKCSESTVVRNWKSFKIKIEEHNNSLNEMIKFKEIIVDEPGISFGIRVR